MRKLNPEKPIRFGDRNRMITSQMVKLFFHSFAPEEYKFKLIFGIQLTTGMRIGEVLPIEVADFFYEEKYATWTGNDWRNLTKDYIALANFIDDLKRNDFSKFKVLLEKKRKENVIVDMTLPKCIKGLLKEYVLKNLRFILRHEGYVFTKNNMRKPYHIGYVSVANVLSKKRKYLHDLYPDLGFADVVSTVNYNAVSGFRKTRKQKLYRFATHSFRKFHALYGYKWAENDSIFAKQLLHHEKLETTQRSYLAHADFVEQRKKFQEQTFGVKVHDMLRHKNSQVSVAWSEAQNR